ncbi:MAG: hypothetical protein QXI60_03300 [Thermofilaceae archaeon]
MREIEEKEMEWEEVETGLARFEKEGDEVAGTILHFEETTIAGRPVRRVVLTNSSGRLTTVLLTTQLERLLTNCKAGDEIRIVYQGWGKTTTGRRFKQFKVYRKREA